MIPPLPVYDTIQLCLHRFYFLFLSVCHVLVPQLFLQSQQASHLFLFTKKGQTDQFCRRNSRLSTVTFSTPSALMFAFLYIWQCTSRKMSTSDTFTEGGSTADGRKMWLWGKNIVLVGACKTRQVNARYRLDLTDSVMPGCQKLSDLFISPVGRAIAATIM